MATLQDLQSALIGADKAGDTEAATTLANEIKRMTQANTASTDEAMKRRALSATPFSFGILTPDVAAGIGQTIGGVGQFASHLIDKIPGVNTAPTVDKAINSAQQRYESDFQPDSFPGSGVARGVGQTIATAPLMAVAPATTLPRIMAQGAGLGAAAGATTPVLGDTTDFFSQKGRQAVQGALTGAATAGAFGLAGRILSPNISPEAQAMLDAKVTPTPGQILGGSFKTAEEKATSIPILGDAIKSAQKSALDEYNVANYNRILGNVGEGYKGPAGQSGIAAVGNRLSDKYEQVLDKSGPSPVTNAFLDKMDELQAFVPSAKQADFSAAIKRYIYDKVTPGNTVTPSVAKDAESELGRLYRTYKGSSVADDRVLANAYAQAQSNVRQLFAENNPAQRQAIDAIDKGWRDLVQLENAASTTKVARNEGVATPADMLRGVKKSDFSARDRAFARGEMPNQDFHQAADKVLSNKYPDSGTTGRYLFNAGVGGLLGLTPVVDGGATLGAASLAALPYLPGGRQLVAGLLAKRPDFMRPVGQFVSDLAPYAGALGPALSGLLR